MYWTIREDEMDAVEGQTSGSGKGWTDRQIHRQAGETWTDRRTDRQPVRREQTDHLSPELEVCFWGGARIQWEGIPACVLEARFSIKSWASECEKGGSIEPPPCRDGLCTYNMFYWQMILCAVYATSKVADKEIQFKQIVNSYRSLPFASTNVSTRPLPRAKVRT